MADYLKPSMIVRNLSLVSRFSECFAASLLNVILENTKRATQNLSSGLELVAYLARRLK